MQAEGLAGVEVHHDRTRIPAERRAIVEDSRVIDARHAAGREPLLVVRASVDPLHESDVRNSAVVGRIADDRDVLRRPRPIRESYGLGERLVARPDLDFEKGHVGSRRFLDEQRSDQFEDELLFAADLLQEVDGRADGASIADAERKSTAVAHREFVRDMPVGDQDVLVDEPPCADPIVRAAGEIDAPDGASRVVQNRLRGFEPRLPDRGVAEIPEIEHGVVVANREHRTLLAHHDTFKLGFVLRRGAGSGHLGHLQARGLQQFFREMRIAIAHFLVEAAQPRQCVERTHVDLLDVVTRPRRLQR